MTAMLRPCRRAPSATPESTGIKSPSMEMGETMLRSWMSPKWLVPSRPLVGESALAMYCIMVSRAANPRTKSEPWFRIMGANQSSLYKDDWFAPMIRNQGSLLVRGFAARDTMMQYMAKADSPTKGRDGTSHFGDIEKRNMVSPISMLGDLIPVLSGVALGARLQGRNIAVMTYIGDGGQSTGVTYEGINFAAVQNLGLVLFVESNEWAYSTPSEMQYRCKDLAERAIGYGIPGVIVDGTDACQVYDAARDAVERAHRGEG